FGFRAAMAFDAVPSQDRHHVVRKIDACPRLIGSTNAAHSQKKPDPKEAVSTLHHDFRSRGRKKVARTIRPHGAADPGSAAPLTILQADNLFASGSTGTDW